MAYGNSGNNSQARNTGYGSANNNKAPARPAAPVAEKGESTTIQLPFYFTKPKKEGTKLVASSIPFDKEVTITIPAGYVVKMFVKGGTSPSGKRLPDFDLVAQPALVKQV